MCIRGLLGLTLVLYVSLATQVGASRVNPEDVCHRAAQRASQSTGVPLVVLNAISLTETGRKRDGRFVPWPWTLNITGTGHWLNNAQDALHLATKTRDAGTHSFDVGCFQINYRWHGHAFASLRDMMDPDTNALYAARFLSELFAESGDWSKAAGSYHSRTEIHAAKYRNIFNRHLSRLTGGVPPPPLEPADLVVVARVNRFPLLQSGTEPAAMGSLVPMGTGSSTSLLQGRSGQPFWSGS